MKVPAFVRGSIAPTFTAFKEDRTLDDRGQRNLLDFMCAQGGVNAFFIRSGMGQMYTFDMDDVKQLTKNCCDHLGGRVPVIVGCNGVWNRDYGKLPEAAEFIAQGVELSKFSEDAGASGVVHTVPDAIAFNGAAEKEALFLRYYSTVCAATKLPVFIYQPPTVAQAYHLTPGLLAQLADIGNLCGVKVSSPNGETIFDLCWATREKDFAYIVGCETAFYAGLLAGAPAAIGQGTTINPKIINAVQNRFEAGDLAGALAAQASVNRLCQVANNPVDFFKAYATEKGYPVGRTIRSISPNPYGHDAKPLSDAEYNAFKVILEEELAQY
ncbi:MAG: dihydrodipicolinate synthase family protein [Candidatus Hydrogenedentes bacterium]|nr:dihydrodipicolinate synthase family protein [Candidatus Hydrogenedentota bacterium]